MNNEVPADDDQEAEDKPEEDKAPAEDNEEAEDKPEEEEDAE